MVFELKQSDKNDEFYFTLKDADGKALIFSEGYKQKASALNGIESVKNNTAAARFELKTSESGSFFFNIIATNGQVVGRSSMFETEAGRESALEALKASVADAITAEI
ncbi:MAG: YegP family protein [Saprospiraceae bacterium]|nr:YegP family protein [Saprospiraceae bacterium]